MSTALDLEPTLYQELEALPENLTGEIVNGTLHAHPRPAGPHAMVSSSIGMEIGIPFYKGRGGPGGWWIIDEPELHLIRDTEVFVPDIAGWRRERMPAIPSDHRFEVVPDWVCEVLSPATAKLDRIEKMPLYAKYGVGHLWLVDPLARTLEAFELRDDQWSVIGLFKDEAKVRVEPFAEVEFSLQELLGS